MIWVIYTAFKENGKKVIFIINEPMRVSRELLARHIWLLCGQNTDPLLIWLKMRTQNIYLRQSK